MSKVMTTRKKGKERKRKKLITKVINSTFFFFLAPREQTRWQTTPRVVAEYFADAGHVSVVCKKAPSYSEYLNPGSEPCFS